MFLPGLQRKRLMDYFEYTAERDLHFSCKL